MKITEGKLRNIIKNALLETINNSEHYTFDNFLNVENYHYVYTDMQSLRDIALGYPITFSRYDMKNGNLIRKENKLYKNDVRIIICKNFNKEEILKNGGEVSLELSLIQRCDLFIDEKLITRAYKFDPATPTDDYSISYVSSVNCFIRPIIRKSPISNKCVVYETNEDFLKKTNNYISLKDYFNDRLCYIADLISC